MTVAGGETKTVTFTISKAEKGMYNVSVYGLKGTFTVKTPVHWSMILIVIAITVLLSALCMGLLLLRKRFRFRLEKK